MVVHAEISPAEAAEWIREVGGRARVELSGGITLETVRAYAETGADFVSSGAITHSARSPFSPPFSSRRKTPQSPLAYHASGSPRPFSLAQS